MACSVVHMASSCPRAYVPDAEGTLAGAATRTAGLGVGQLVEELLFSAQLVLCPCLHEGWVPDWRAEDDDAALGIGLVASSHQFRNPRRSRAGFGNGHPNLAQIGRDATPFFDSAHGDVQGGSRSRRLRDHVKVVQKATRLSSGCSDLPLASFPTRAKSLSRSQWQATRARGSCDLEQSRSLAQGAAGL